MLANTAYSSNLDDAFCYDRSGQNSKVLRRKRKNFTQDLAIRLEDVQLESCDALRIIRSRDTAQTFFYCDPPYIGADQGHYDGYSVDNYQALLDTLAAIKGKFLLSSYRSKELAVMVSCQAWHSIEIEMPKAGSRGKTKIEVLTANYPIQLIDSRNLFERAEMEAYCNENIV